MAESVKIDGLSQLRRNLKQIDADLPKELRREFLAVGQTIAADARGHVPRQSGRAAASVKAGVSGNRAYVQGGKKTVPYYGWLDFGGQLPSKKSGKKARTVRPRIKRGRYLYPAIDRHRDEIIRRAAAAIASTIKKAGF